MNVNTRVSAGDRFGSVVVIDRIRRGKRNARVRCDCGNEFNTYTYTLEGGSTQRCKSCTDELRRGKPLLANRIDPLERTVNELWNTFRKAMRTRPGSSLTKDEWLAAVSSPCAYCGREGVNRKRATVDHAVDFCYNGVDRIDSSQPYALGNVQAACWPCNRMKGNMSHEEFIEHVELISNYHRIDRASTGGL